MNMEIDKEYVNNPLNSKWFSNKRIKNIIIFIRAWLVFLLVWQIFAIYIDNHLLVASPIEVFNTLVRITETGEIFYYIMASMGRLLTGYFLAIIIGVGLGLLMGMNYWVRNAMDPVIEIFRPITAIAWIPIGFLVFGIGNILPVFIVFYTAFFPILTNTIHAVRTVDPILIRSAKTMGIPKRTVVSHVIIPSSIPLVLTGLRVGVALAWMGIVAGELLGASSGLGYELALSQQLFETSKLFALIAVIGVLGFASDFIIRFIQGKVAFWE